MNVHTKYIHSIICGTGGGGILVDIKMHPFCYQKVATRSRSVSVNSDLSYDASRVHRRGRGDNSKN